MLVAWTLKMAHICYDYDQEADLWGCRAHPGSHQATKCIHGNRSGKKNREHHTHQTALYFQCVIGCMMKKEMTLQCGQSGLFNLHCSSIHPRQHTKLEQVVFICQLLKTLLHHTADISTALEAVLLLFHITFAPWSPFSVHVRKLSLVTRNTLHAKVTIPLRRQQQGPCPFGINKGESLFSSKMD